MSSAQSHFTDRIFLSPNLSIERPTAADFDYLLKSSGLTPEVVEQARIGRVTHLDGKALVGGSHKGNMSGLVFPSCWPGETNARSYTIRRDSPDQEAKSDGSLKDLKKYVMPEGASNTLSFVYGTDPALLSDVTVPALIAEGPKKLYAAYRLAWHGLGEAAEKPRFLPMALSGVWNFRGRIGKATSKTGERVDVRGVIEDFERITWTDRKVIVVYDRDVLDNTSVQDALRALVKVLQEFGARVFVFPWAKDSIDLPANAKSLDELLAITGPENVIDFINKAKPRKGPKPKK